MLPHESSILPAFPFASNPKPQRMIAADAKPVIAIAGLPVQLMTKAQVVITTMPVQELSQPATFLNSEAPMTKSNTRLGRYPSSTADPKAAEAISQIAVVRAPDSSQ